MTKSTKAKFLQSLLLIISFALLCCLIACGGSKDEAAGTGTDTTTTAVASLVLSVPASVTFGHPVTVIATLRNASGVLVDGSVVTFAASSGLVTFTPTSATDLTGNGGTGVASVILSAASNSSAGATYITASADIISGGTTTTVTSTPVGISVGAAAVTLGTLTITSPSISAYGTSSLSVPVLIGGSPATVPISVAFTSNCVQGGTATLTSPVTNNTSTGIATSTYKDNGCSGTDTIIASVTGGATASAPITVATPATNNIQFVSATPEIIGTSTAGAATLPKSSLVKFKVVDSNNHGKSGVLVDFSLGPPGAPGGIALSATSATSDVDGYVTTSVTSGTVPTPVWVVAKVNGSGTPGILTQSNTLTITTGLPTQNFFSLSVSAHSIEGWNYDGVTSTVTIIASDRLGNPVPDGTAINFISEGGHFSSGSNKATCSAIGGTCTVTFTSAAYRPIGETIIYPGPVTHGAVAALEYDDVTPITITYYDGTSSGPLYVQNGRVTILAYALGEKSFVDGNGNNSYDAGETFYDLGDLYVDYNENGVWDSNSTQPNLVEPYINYASVPSPVACQTHYWVGGVEHTGSLPSDYVSSPSKETTCSGTWEQNYVRRSQIMILSTSSPQISQYKFQTETGCFAVYNFWLMDGNYNPMPAGTTVAINSSYSNVIYTYHDPGPPPKTIGATASTAVGGSPVPDNIHAGGTKVGVIINGGSGCIAAETAGTLISYPVGPVAIDVTSPKGLVTTIPITITNPTLILTASLYSVAVGNNSTLTATFTDIYGNPVSGLTVNFSISTNNSGATLSAASAITNGSGQASVTYTAGVTSGVNDSISASTSYNGYNATDAVSISVTP